MPAEHSISSCRAAVGADLQCFLPNLQTFFISVFMPFSLLNVAALCIAFSNRIFTSGPLWPPHFFLALRGNLPPGFPMDHSETPTSGDPQRGLTWPVWAGCLHWAQQNFWGDVEEPPCVPQNMGQPKYPTHSYLNPHGANAGRVA